MKPTTFLAIAVVSAVVQPIVAAQVGDNSLRSRAKASGGEAKSLVIADFSSYRVPELARRADVIVHGHVVETRSHLIDNETTVVTDVTVLARRTLKESTPIAWRPQPGATAPLVVRYVGGTVVEGGLRMTTNVSAFPSNEALKPGDDVVLFLLYEPNERVFELVDGPFAAFRVTQGRVSYLTNAAGSEMGDRDPAPIATFLADVYRLARIR